MKYSSSQSGYTLNEVMITIFISSLLAVLLGTVLVASNRVFQLTRASVDIQTEIGRIQTLMQKDIRGAESVSEYPLGSPTYVSDDDTLVIRQASIDALDQMIPATYDYIIYSTSGGGSLTLTREVVANGVGRNSSTNILSNNLDNIRYLYNADPITDSTEINSEFTLTKSYSITDRTLTTSITTLLRN